MTSDSSPMGEVQKTLSEGERYDNNSSPMGEVRRGTDLPADTTTLTQNFNAHGFALNFYPLPEVEGYAVIASEGSERGNLISQDSGVLELNNEIITHSSNAHNDINNSSPIGEVARSAEGERISFQSHPTGISKLTSS